MHIYRIVHNTGKSCEIAADSLMHAYNKLNWLPTDCNVTAELECNAIFLEYYNGEKTCEDLPWYSQASFGHKERDCS